MHVNLDGIILLFHIVEGPQGPRDGRRRGPSVKAGVRDAMGVLDDGWVLDAVGVELVAFGLTHNNCA